MSDPRPPTLDYQRPTGPVRVSATGPSIRFAGGAVVAVVLCAVAVHPAVPAQFGVGDICGAIGVLLEMAALAYLFRLGWSFRTRLTARPAAERGAVVTCAAGFLSVALPAAAAALASKTAWGSSDHMGYVVVFGTIACTAVSGWAAFRASA